MREVSRSTTALGILTAFLGVVALMAPLFTGVSITIMIGMLLLIGGIAGSIYAFKAPTLSEGVWKFLFGGLTLVCGLLLLANPVEGLGALTIILAIFLLVEGIAKIAMAMRVKPEDGWGWILFSGIMSILFTVLIYAQWPVSGVWAVSIVIGAWLLVYGLSMASVGSAAKDAITELQDTRVAALETEVVALSGALAELQVEFAGSLIAQMELQATLNEKVSKADVDPALSGLNSELSTIRAQYETASADAKKTGKALGAGIHAAVSSLRKKINEQGKDLGL
jgi:uncharacterized membrane protein HdeD (DUF308 family)